MYTHVLPCCHSRTCNFPWPATSPITSDLTARSAWVPRADITFKIILHPQSDSVSKSRYFFFTSSQIAHHLTIANPWGKKMVSARLVLDACYPHPTVMNVSQGFWWWNVAFHWSLFPSTHHPHCKVRAPQDVWQNRKDRFQAFLESLHSWRWDPWAPAITSISPDATQRKELAASGSFRRL